MYSKRLVIIGSIRSTGTLAGFTPTMLDICKALNAHCLHPAQKLRLHDCTGGRSHQSREPNVHDRMLMLSPRDSCASCYASRR